MSLPRIEVPRYKCVLPVSQIEVSYRPFLVGEQKTLLVAQEGDDNQNSVSEIIRLLQACTEGDVDLISLPAPDVEYLFIKIRVASVGETSKMQLSCNQEDCNEMTVVELELDKVEIESDNNSNIVELTEGLSIELSPPNLFELAKIEEKVQQNSGIIVRGSEVSFQVLNKYISKVINEDEIITRDDFSDEELDVFLEGLTLDMLDKISKYLEGQPKLVLNLNYQCSKCDKMIEQKLTGIQNFFG